ncbi:hypothetical protein ACFWPA_10325 [Rhodococcus sp. NPDC058505]|uniref:hypothetical protein n=1 Tax=unclassified Rhodococcus (in: high G+C Gram-positive bacteria) TaxID=192944 RepID=UPI0036625BE2
MSAAVRTRLAVVAAAVCGMAGVSAVPALAQGGPSAAPSSGAAVVDAPLETLCTPTDPGLAELSGLASDGDRMFAIGDSGTDRTLWVLGPDCAVTGALPVPATPTDVEDLALVDGRLWLSDTGDNARVRSSVALTVLDPGTGSGSTHLLGYPDGAHDAEAFLVGRDGRPVIVTKEVLAPSGIYTTDLPLDELPAGPTPLRRVGQLTVAPTDTPGGPLPVASSVLVTGGAVSGDGRVVAVRTYTDLYLYPAADGDVVAALTGATPVRVPMPHQPQGEAIAFTPDGDLVSGSEAADGPMPPIQVLRGAAALVPLPDPTPVDEPLAGRTGSAAVAAALVGVGAVVIAAAGAAVVRFRSRRR